MTEAWYAVRTAFGCEFKARDEIQNELGLDVYLPMRRRTVFLRGKRSSRRRPMCPGYVFVHCDMNFIFMHAILERRHVQDILRAIGSWDPVPIPERDMEALTFMEWQKEVELEDLEKFQQDLKPGVSVELLKGLLKSRVLRVVRVDADGQIRLVDPEDRTVRPIKVERTAVVRVA